MKKKIAVSLVALLSASTFVAARNLVIVKAKELPDGEIPTAAEDGNFVVGPTHKKAAEMNANPDVPKGEIKKITFSSTDSKIYPGIARQQGTFGKPDANNPAKLDVTTSGPQPWKRTVSVYIPKQYVPGTPAPFIVTNDGDTSLFTPLDNLIAAKKVPAMIAIAIPSGGGDAQGSQRGLEYDTMSGVFADFVEKEILPRIEKECGVTLSKDPDARAAMGCSSGAAAALIMAWYRPDLYRRVISYSGTFVNQQWPYNPETPGGAWELHKTLIPKSDAKPIRIWMQVSENDLLNPNIMRDNMHDWVAANDNMAKVLADKGYKYQFLFTKKSGHCDGGVRNQTLPEALEYVWKDYKEKAGK